MSRKEQQIGKQGENLANIRLCSIGLEMVEKVGTPVRLIPLPKHLRVNIKNAYRVIFGEKVSGDRRAIIPGAGTSVLIETKTIFDRNLRWSDLRSHQPGRLDRHSELGGISLLVWVHETGIYILRWPVSGFSYRKSITVETASELQINDIKEL